jgi:hypothetical protein
MKNECSQRLEVVNNGATNLAETALVFFIPQHFAVLVRKPKFYRRQLATSPELD